MYMIHNTWIESSYSNISSLYSHQPASLDISVSPGPNYTQSNNVQHWYDYYIENDLRHDEMNTIGRFFLSSTSFGENYS